MSKEPIAIGTVESLAINGEPVEHIRFNLNGPLNDVHAGFSRSLSGHDGAYIRTSDLEKGHSVFNWRSWTGLSVEELDYVESAIGYPIPIGCLLENIVFSGIPEFSQIAPTSRLVFPRRGKNQAILTVWEENGPCKTVGERLEQHHGVSGLKTDFIKHAQQKRGVMGFVLAEGIVSVGDAVKLYPPVA